MRQCPDCSEPQPEENFTKGGLYCRVHQTARCKIYRKRLAGTTRRCPSCKEIKPPEEYSGGYCYCKSCTTAKYRARRTKPHGWAASVIRSARDRASKAGLPFDLDADYVCSIMPKDHKCPVLGCRLYYGRPEHGRKQQASLDRIFPHLGYIRGNVAIISNYANAIKQNADSKTIRQVADWVEVQEKIHRESSGQPDVVWV